MSVAAASLITLDQLKTYLGPTFAAAADTSNDALLESLIDSVSEWFNSHIGRTLAKTTYTNVYFDGPGKPTLRLPNGPVSVLTSLYEDDDLLAEGIDEDFVLYAGEPPSYLARLEKLNGVWLKGPKTVKATLTAGFVVQGVTPGTGETALPNDIRLACAIQVAREWKKTQGSEWGESSRTFPDGSTSRIERGLLKDVEEILAKYRRFRI